MIFVKSSRQSLLEYNSSHLTNLNRPWQFLTYRFEILTYANLLVLKRIVRKFF